MNIKVLKEFHLNEEVHQVRTCEVNLGPNGTGMLFAYSKYPNIDPCESSFRLNRYPMELAMFGEAGQMLWHKELEMEIIAGIWTMPFVAIDMDQDGIDEIYYVGNRHKDAPTDSRAMTLECLYGLSGEYKGHCHFEAENLEWERLGWAFRFMLCGGYADKEPVLVAAQGIYGEIYLQAYDSDLNIRWRRRIGREEGSGGSHQTLVFDFNHDGNDEVLYGEHMVSLKDGKDVICYDRDRYFGHSDIVLPIMHPETKKMYLYTCRESGDYEGCPRVVTFDMETGNVVWEDIYSDEWGHYIDDGHMHIGWVAAVRNMPQSGKPGKLAYAKRMRNKKQLVEHYTYDVFTGEKVDYPFPYPFDQVMPIDINGDGYHEFIKSSQAIAGSSGLEIVDDKGEKVAYVGGHLMDVGKYFDYPGEQFMCFYPYEGVVRLWGDADAQESAIFRERYANGFLKSTMKTRGSGYNWHVECAI